MLNRPFYGGEDVKAGVFFYNSWKVRLIFNYLLDRAFGSYSISAPERSESSWETSGL